MLSSPTKITFKNTTKMSLNARFTTIMKTRPAPSPQTVKMQASTTRLASEKNRRLAQQMERRPAVEQALGGKRKNLSAKPAQTKAALTKVSVLDRLGNRGGGVIGRGKAPISQSTRGSGNIASRIGGVRRGQNTINANRRGTAGRGRGAFNKNRIGSKPISARGRGNTRGGGNFRGRGKKPSPANKGDLDSDLDKYMSKTKGTMDAELDAYRANAK